MATQSGVRVQNSCLHVESPIIQSKLESLEVAAVLWESVSGGQRVCHRKLEWLLEERR